jgi:DNA primase
MTYTSVDIADETIQRYKHCKDEESIIPIKHLLYNAETSDGNTVYPVEGLFDCWRIGDGATPTWGVKFTAEQKRLLAKFANIVIIGDGDKDGWKYNEKLGNEMSAFCNVRYFKLHAGLDPDKLSEDEIKFIKGKK